MAGTPEIARVNGKKGGRPKGSKANHTIQAERGKALLIEAYMKNVAPINEALLKKAKEGDIAAIKELHDRVWGKANQSIDLSGKVEQIVTASPEAIKLAKEYEQRLKKRL